MSEKQCPSGIVFFNMYINDLRPTIPRKFPIDEDEENISYSRQRGRVVKAPD